MIWLGCIEVRASVHPHPFSLSSFSCLFPCSKTWTCIPLVGKYRSPSKAGTIGFRFQLCGVTSPCPCLAIPPAWLGECLFGLPPEPSKEVPYSYIASSIRAPVSREIIVGGCGITVGTEIEKYQRFRKSAPTRIELAMRNNYRQHSCLPVISRHFPPSPATHGHVGQGLIIPRSLVRVQSPLPIPPP